MSFSTWVYTRLFGNLVGMDEYGNNYYCAKSKIKNGRERRWVLYKDEAEPSLVPPEWHAWLHHTIDKPLTERGVDQEEWQLKHIPNLTGTSRAYKPRGHAVKKGSQPAATSDYKAWTPE